MLTIQSADESFTHANVALADKLLQFADAQTDGRTLDIGFGGGETLRKCLRAPVLLGSDQLPRSAHSCLHVCPS